LIEEGAAAPDFELEGDDGSKVRLSELRGKLIVLYFYPKDNTPGCTKQACGFRDSHREYAERGAVVLGVSPDDTASHRKFKEKYSLPFTLLADPEHEIAEAYGAWGEKSFAGKKYMGVIRSTFVIGPDGKVGRAMYGVNAERNPADVLAAL